MGLIIVSILVYCLVFYVDIRLCSYIKELETSLDDVKKAVFRETKVKDKEHDIEKTKERILELHR